MRMGESLQESGREVGRPPLRGSGAVVDDLKGERDVEERGLSLDDRLFFLQRTRLPPELSAMVHQADVAYLQGREEEASRLVAEVERRCAEMGIRIARPTDLFGWI